jgi:antitoxin PrlF
MIFFTVKSKEMPTQVFSKLSAKGQVTVPKRVREVIGIRAGDSIVYEIEGSTVRMRKVEPFDLAFHAALSQTLDEWTTEEDDEAFRDL